MFLLLHLRTHPSLSPFFPSMTDLSLFVSWAWYEILISVLFGFILIRASYCASIYCPQSEILERILTVDIENIWRSANELQAPKRQIRSRGLSEISHQSIGSNEEDILLGNRFSYPVRQPYGAPEFAGQKQGFHHRPIRQPNKAPPSMVGARVEGFMSFPQRLPSRRPSSPPTDLAQQHAGFQRFLKEHASPPHHRVTAGGRIVPANGPPPIFNVNSLTGAIKSPLRSETTTTTNTVKADEVKKRAASVSGPLFASAASRHGILVSGASEQSGIVQNATPQDPSTGQAVDQTMSKEAQTGTTVQYPPNTAPIMLLQDGTTFVMQNGLPYRVYSNGFATFTEPVPLLFAQQGAAAPVSSASLLQPAVPSLPNFASPYGPLRDSLPHCSKWKAIRAA